MPLTSDQLLRGINHLLKSQSYKPEDADVKEDFLTYPKWLRDGLRDGEKLYVKMCEDARGKYFVRCDPPEPSVAPKREKSAGFNWYDDSCLVEQMPRKPREWELIGTGFGNVAHGWQLKFGERVKVVEVIE